MAGASSMSGSLSQPSSSMTRRTWSDAAMMVSRGGQHRQRRRREAAVVEERQHAEVRAVQLVERSLVLDRHVVLAGPRHRGADVARDAEPGEAVVQRPLVLVLHASDQLSARR